MPADMQWAARVGVADTGQLGCAQWLWFAIHFPDEAWGLVRKLWPSHIREFLHPASVQHKSAKGR